MGYKKFTEQPEGSFASKATLQPTANPKLLEKAAETYGVEVEQFCSKILEICDKHSILINPYLTPLNTMIYNGNNATDKLLEKTKNDLIEYTPASPEEAKTITDNLKSIREVVLGTRVDRSL